MANQFGVLKYYSYRKGSSVAFLGAFDTFEKADAFCKQVAFSELKKKGAKCRVLDEEAEEYVEKEIESADDLETREKTKESKREWPGYYGWEESYVYMSGASIKEYSVQDGFNQYRYAVVETPIDE